MDLEMEINPIAIAADAYNVQIANLVEHLLMLDQKMYETDKTHDPRGAA